MSASREKKQRQDDPNQGLTQKQIKERKEAAIKKRNTVIYTVIGVVVAVLVVALLVWNSGFFQSRTVAMTINGQDYSPAEVSYYYGQTKQSYGYYLSMMGYDSTKSDRDQVVDEESGKTFYDLFMEQAKATMIKEAALADAAREEGVTLTEESQEQLETALESYRSGASQSGYPSLNSFLKAYFGSYMNEKVLRSCLEESLLASQYQTAYSDSLTYDDAALEEYYTENAADLDTFRYHTIFFSGTAESTTDEEGNTVEPTEEEQTAAMEAAKAKADAFRSEVEKSDFATAAEAAKAEDEDLTYEGEMSHVGSALAGPYQEWLSDSSRKAGDITVVESEGSGYYVVQFVERFRNEDDFGTANIRHILVKAEVAEGAEEPTEEAMQAAEDKAQEILDQFKAGDQSADSFAELAKANSEDPGSKDNGGLYEDVTRDTSFFADFLNWIFADGRKVGDTGLVENTQSGQQGWHVMYLDSVGDPLWKYTAENDLRDADVQTWLEGLQEGYEAVDGSGIQYIG